MHNHEIEAAENLFVHILEHTLGDTLHLIPFLLVVFIILEYMEHSMSEKSVAAIQKAGKAGPLLGGVIGAFPQCGFSIMATNLFAGRVVSIGTLVAVYLSTSDEMLPVMLAGNTPIIDIIKIILLKCAIGIAAGFAVDFSLKVTQNRRHKHSHNHSHHLEHNHHDGEHDDDHEHHHISDFCAEEGCHCGEESPLVSAIKHTVKIFIVIFAVSFLLNLVIDLAGVEIIEETVSKAGIWAPVVACVIGLIPNCAASVAITQLYLSGAISLGTAMAGLLTGSGIAWIVLFRVNPHSRQNFKIMGVVFIVGAVSGILMNAVGLAI